MRVTKKIIAVVMTMCMLLQISGVAVIADDAVNSRGTEISDAAALGSGESVHAADSDSASAASEASAESKESFSAGSEELHAQSQETDSVTADEGLSAESSSDKSELNTNRAELSDPANEAETAGNSEKSVGKAEELAGNGKSAGEEKAAKDKKAAEDEVADEDEKSAGDEEASEDEEEIQGNVTAKDAGIVIEGAGEFDILVTGTVKSEGTPILIDQTVDPDNVSITVWKIEEPVQAETDGKKEEHVVLEGKLGEAQTVTEDSKKVEAAIRYIIKIDPSQEDLIDLEGTEKSHDYDTAREGETVTLKISVPDGYKLIGAFNGMGDKIPLKKDDHGNYYVVVPKAGGVYLSAEFEKDADDDDDDDECSGSRAVSVCSYADRSREREECDLARKCNRIIYDLNGGTLNGDKGPIIIEAERDKEYKLLEAPKKPGANFIRWASSCKDVRVSKPGEAFVFEHCVKFTAVWDDDSIGRCGRHTVRKNCDDEDEDDDEDAEGEDGPDVTETVRVTEESEEELNINSIKVDDNPAVGIEIIAARDIDVDEDITVTGGDQGATGIKASAGGKSVTSEVETGSGMKVKSEGSSVGIEASASDGGSLSLDFEGSIDVSSGSGSSVGISAHADSGSAVSIGIR